MPLVDCVSFETVLGFLWKLCILIIQACEQGTGQTEKSASRASEAQYGLDFCLRPIPHLGVDIGSAHFCYKKKDIVEVNR